ncbi:MAG: hypothetical protein QM770_10315 [Tepidisphaeraceae bacterium]
MLLFVRDADPKGIGFITQHRLPLGYGGRLQIALPDGENDLEAGCTIYRCRPCSSDWFEGALTFNRAQHVFTE